MEKTPRIRQNGDNREIFDQIRKKWLLLTPEEFVRQHFVLYLTQKLGYDANLIGVEREFIIAGGKKLRSDIVVFDKNGAPYIVVECKAQSVKIDEECFRQVSKYNAFFKAKYVVLTNLNETFFFETSDFITYNRVLKVPNQINL